LRQVEEIRKVFASKEATLHKERDEAIKARDAAQQSLKTIDDAFRQELETKSRLIVHYIEIMVEIVK
jgi:hypothetical protein